MFFEKFDSTSTKSKRLYNKKGKNMENLTASSFDFDNIVSEIGKDPFSTQAEKYAEDTRFYKLKKDKEGNGGAVIRFLPDKNKNLIQQVNKIATTIVKNGKKRFVNELSPITIGQPCPFQEEWARLYNSGDKEGAKSFSRTTRFYTNIKVIKDPLSPENEGKIFLLDMSATLKDKIQKLLNPSQADKDLGAKAYQLFNPIKGNSFRLVARKGANGIPNYDSSDVIMEENGIYDTVEAAFKDITENTHDLSEFRNPSTFLSYEKLQEKLKWVTFADIQTAPVQVVAVASVASPVQETTTQVTNTQEVNSAPVETPTQTAEQPVQDQSQSLDKMLEGLL